MNEFVRGIVTFPPAPAPMGRTAVLVGLATAVPVIGFSLLGRPDDGLLASLGAVTVLYCGDRSLRARTRLLPFIALTLVLSAAVGATTAGSSGLMLIGLILVTVVSILLCVGFDIGPPGPMFVVLVYGSAAAVAAPVSAGGGGENRLLVVVLVAIGSAFALGLAGLTDRPSRPARQSSAPRDSTGFRLTGDHRLFALRMILVTVLCVLVSVPLGVRHAAVILMTALSIPIPYTSKSLSLLRSADRVCGVLAGSAIFLALSFIPVRGVVLGVVLGLLQGLIAAVVTRNFAVALVLVTPLSLLIATSVPGSDRFGATAGWILESLVGAAVAAGVLGLAERNPGPANPRQEAIL